MTLKGLFETLESMVGNPADWIQCLKFGVPQPPFQFEKYLESVAHDEAYITLDGYPARRFTTRICDVCHAAGYPGFVEIVIPVDKASRGPGDPGNVLPSYFA